jgi:hypothetical protein
VALAERMLSVELAMFGDGWLWHSGMTGNMQRLGLAVLISLWRKMRRVGWGMLLVVQSPLHGVVDFLGCG